MRYKGLSTYHVSQLEEAEALDSALYSSSQLAVARHFSDDFPIPFNCIFPIALEVNIFSHGASLILLLVI